jgi:glutathione S-transferase
MSEIIVHTAPASPFGRAVLLALEEKSARYRLVPINITTLRTPEYRALHPFSRIPVMEHGGFRLYETQAIMRYIDRALPGPALTPSDNQTAARMDQLMNVNDWYLFQGVNNVIGFQRIVGPRVMGLTPDEAAIAAVMPKAHVVFDELARQLGDQAFFVGDSISLADLLLAPQLYFLSRTPEWQPLTQHHANLRRWLDRMNARPSMCATSWERLEAQATAA